jgi:hypothetical protein
MLLWVFICSVAVLALGLPIFSYLTLIYRELGRMTTGRVHEHLELFEAESSPSSKSIARAAVAPSASSATSGWPSSFSKPPAA